MLKQLSITAMHAFAVRAEKQFIEYNGLSALYVVCNIESKH